MLFFHRYFSQPWRDSSGKVILLQTQDPQQHLLLQLQIFQLKTAGFMFIFINSRTKENVPYNILSLCYIMSPSTFCLPFMHSWLQLQALRGGKSGHAMYSKDNHFITWILHSLAWPDPTKSGHARLGTIYTGDETNLGLQHPRPAG